MTYNIYHGEGLDGKVSLERIANVIKQAKAEIVGLQEVDKHFGKRSLFQDQAKELAQILQYEYVYGANLQYPPLEKGKEPRQYGTAILSKHPIIQAKNQLYTHFSDEPRGILQAIISVNHLQLTVLNTHLDLDFEYRMKQVEEIVQLAKNIEGPKVLLGDFNAEPESADIQKLLNETDFHDCLPSNTNGTYPTNDPKKKIDYIFGSREITFQEAFIGQFDGSDHLPVIANMTIQR